MDGLNIVKLTNLDLELPGLYAVQLMFHDQKTWNNPIMLGLIKIRYTKLSTPLFN